MMNEYVVTQIGWHRADVVRPPVSGSYLTYNTYAKYVSTVEYSEKYDMFNVCDHMSAERAAEYGLKVDYWAPIPDELLKQRRD